MSNQKKHPIFIVSGQPKSGKHRLVERLLAAIPTLSRVITTTDRKPESGEKNHKHYHYVSVSTFSGFIATQRLIEHETVQGSRYGIRGIDILEARKTGPVIVIVNPDGAEKIPVMFKDEQVYAMFITTDKAIIRERLLPFCVNHAEHNRKCEEAVNDLLAAGSPIFHRIINNREGYFEDSFRQLFNFVSEVLHYKN